MTNTYLLVVLIRKPDLKEINGKLIIAKNIKEKFVPLTQHALQLGLNLK
jgi:hypothetical protein